MLIISHMFYAIISNFLRCNRIRQVHPRESAWTLRMTGLCFLNGMSNHYAIAYADTPEENIFLNQLQSQSYPLMY